MLENIYFPAYRQQAHSAMAITNTECQFLVSFLRIHVLVTGIKNALNLMDMQQTDETLKSNCLLDNLKMIQTISVLLPVRMKNHVADCPMKKAGQLTE